jgi:hypothetical protein
MCLVIAAFGCAGQTQTDPATEPVSESCPMSVATYCDGLTQNCPPTWVAAQQQAAWRCGPGTDGAVTLSTCGAVHVASVAYEDAGEDLYYDASGALYRVEEFINVTQRCLAGTGQPLGSRGALEDCEDPAPRTLCTPGL